MKTGRNKPKKSNLIAMILSVIVIGLLAYTAFRGLTIFGVFKIKPFSEVIKQGLDLQGGVSVVMEIQDDDVTKEQLENTKEQLELRVNKVGVAETVVTTEGDKRIRIDIPGQYDSSEIVDSLSKSGELTFTSPDGDVLLTGSDVKKATVVTNQETNKLEIQLEMTEDGKSKFADATTKYVGKAISIKMDDEVLSSPTVETAITDGTAQITGNYTTESAKRLAGLINSGALPVTVKAASVQTVGSSLGADALPNALKAAIVGIALVFVFMLIIYRIPGLLADLALALFIYLVLFIFGEIGVTLTLPGIAALMLTIGMAVDANVLIFERTKEELRKGISVKTAVQKGFENARSSIIDSNVTTILAALVLYFFGSGSVKGFAVTLLVGVLVSMFTALTVTRFLVKMSVGARILSKLSHFGVKKESEKPSSSKVFDIIGRKKIWFSVSLTIIILGIIFSIARGVNIGIDFKGGTQLVLQLEDGYNKEEVDSITAKYTDNYVSNTVDGNQYQVKSSNLDSEAVGKLVDELKDKYSLDDDIVVSQDEIGASIGNELKKNSLIALSIAFVVMLIYIAIRFQFSYGIAALIALFHDILVTISFYTIFDVQINSPFIAAILTVIGYSMNDTIVIFDRIRENIKKFRGKENSEVANISIKDTIRRSIYTSLTTLFTIVSVCVFVPAVRNFAMPLIVGIVAGSYSSIFIASPIWVMLKSKHSKHKKSEEDKKQTVQA